MSVDVEDGRVMIGSYISACMFFNKCEVIDYGAFIGSSGFHPPEYAPSNSSSPLPSRCQSLVRIMFAVIARIKYKFYFMASKNAYQS